MSLFIAHLLEKAVDQLFAFILQKTAVNQWIMSKTLNDRKVKDSAKGTGFNIFRRIIDIADAGLQDGSGTHWAWFQRNIELAVIQFPGFQLPAGCFNGHHFCMPFDLLELFPAVMSSADYFSLADNNRSNRYFADFEGLSASFKASFMYSSAFIS